MHAFGHWSWYDKFLKLSRKYELTYCTYFDNKYEDENLCEVCNLLLIDHFYGTTNFLLFFCINRFGFVVFIAPVLTTIKKSQSALFSLALQPRQNSLLFIGLAIMAMILQSCSIELPCYKIHNQSRSIDVFIFCFFLSCLQLYRCRCLNLFK